MANHKMGIKTINFCILQLIQVRYLQFVYQLQLLIYYRVMLSRFAGRSAGHLLRVRFSLSYQNDYYGILDVSGDASFKQIKERYLQKAKQYHPDRSTSAIDQYHRVQQAYKTLIDPSKRKKYDLSLGRIDSAWQRQLSDHSFSSSFQSEIYDELLKQGNSPANRSSLSKQESLRQQFDEEISRFEFKQLYRSGSFMVSVVGVMMFWGVWNFVEFILANYEGRNEHQVKMAMTDASLKIVPTFTR